MIKTIYKKFKRKINRIEYHFKKKYLSIDFPKSIRIQDPVETLEQVESIIKRKIPGGYLRFGDGDLNLLYEIDDLMQYSLPEIAKEMREAFELSGKGIIKSLPLHSNRFGKEKGMKPGVHESSDIEALRFLNLSYKYFIGDRIYSTVALAYLAVEKPEIAINFLKTIKSNNTIFIGNENVPSTILKKIFNTEIHIKTPAKNAYEKINQVEENTNRILNKDKYIVVILAMGCTGRILSKRLLKSNQNVFIFDFGSLLDALCGWNTRAWIELTGKDQKYWDNFIDKI